MFYISSSGHTATTWLSTALSSHPNIECWHSTKSVPPSFPPISKIRRTAKNGKFLEISVSRENDLSEEEFVKHLFMYEQSMNGKYQRNNHYENVKKIGACHGFHGTRLLKYINQYNGTFLAIARNPIKKISSLCLDVFFNKSPLNNLVYRFDIEEFYLEYGDKINSKFNMINNLVKENEKIIKEKKIKKKIITQTLKNLNLYYPLKKIYEFKKKFNNSKYIVVKKKKKVKKMIKKFGADFIAEKIILNFIASCQRTLDADDQIYKKIGFEDFICMEKMIVSPSYFNNKIFKKILKKDAEKHYLSTVFEVKPMNRHVSKILSATEIYNSWPKSFKNYFSEIYENSKAKKMYAMMNYKIEKII